MTKLAKLSILTALLGAFATTGCCSKAATAEPKLIAIPLMRQATDHTCGVASLQAILAYYGVDCREDLLAQKLKADQYANIDEIGNYMTGLGFTVKRHDNMSLAQLKDCIDRGQPLMVCVQAWEPEGTTLEQYQNCWDAGHWVVVIGYDAQNIYVMDPSTAGNYAFVPTAEFMVRWHDRDDRQTLLHFGMTFESARAPVYRRDEFKKMQ